MTDAMTQRLSDRLEVLEVMVEMLTSRDILEEADPDQAASDYRDVAIIALSHRRTEDEMDGAVSVLDERLIKIQEHISAYLHALN